jgi:hypothetical protein
MSEGEVTMKVAVNWNLKPEARSQDVPTSTMQGTTTVTVEKCRRWAGRLPIPRSTLRR